MSRAALASLTCVALTLTAGCTGDPTDSAAEASTTLPERAGPAVPVDPCGLAPKAVVGKAMGEDLRVVGRRVEAPTLPTESCLWGTEFSVARLEVRVTPGPVAKDTFVRALGPGAGGEPERVSGLGDAAYSRSGLTDRSLHVLADGTVLSLEAKDAPGRPLPDAALQEIGAAAVESLPGNPGLADGHRTQPCARVEERRAADVLGGRPQLRRAHRSDDGATMCSWGALPGNLVVTVRTNPTQVTNFRANLSPRIYVDVDGTGVETYSQTDRAGDLLMFVSGSLIEVDALPAEGYPSEDTPTSQAELRLARVVVAAFS